MKLMRSGLLLSVALLVFASIIATPVACAAGGQSFAINPPLMNLKADPGQTVMASIRFTNLSDDALLITPKANDFSARDESGDPKVQLDTTKTQAYGMQRWVQLPAPFTLASRQAKTLDVPIAVPKNAEPGGHYGVIRFGGAPPEAAPNSVSFSASLGTLVLLTVSGEIRERASLTEFYAGNSKLQKSSLLENGPVGFAARVSNDGNVHVQPTGTITIKNTFGKQISELRVNGTPGNPKDPPKNVLPNSIRRFQTTLDKKWLFGRYTAHLDLTYGQTGKHLTADTTFWVIPYKLLIALVVFLVASAWFARTGIKKYNKRIIQKAHHKKQK